MLPAALVASPASRWGWLQVKSASLAKYFPPLNPSTCCSASLASKRATCCSRKLLDEPRLGWGLSLNFRRTSYFYLCSKAIAITHTHKCALWSTTVAAKRSSGSPEGRFIRRGFREPAQLSLVCFKLTLNSSRSTAIISCIKAEQQHGTHVFLAQSEGE